MRDEGSSAGRLLTLSDEPHLSPSLTRAHLPAFEVKFLVPEEQAAEIERWARGRLDPDPHGDPSRGGTYAITTVYCDTADFNVLRKSDRYRRRKFRLRRYGDSELIYLERKTRLGSEVRKRRSSVLEPELALLASPVCLPDWAGNWFHRRVWFKQLGPTCSLSYLRTAFGRQTDDGQVRLTIDRHLRSQRTRHWKVPASGKGQAILVGQAVLEFKYRETMPTMLKQALEQFNLHPTSHSKYRSAMAAWGITGGRPAEAVAHA